MERLTRKYVLWWVYGLAVLEVFLIALNAMGIKIRLVSQIVEGVAFRGLPTLAYILTGMCAHWFITWRRIPWSDPVSNWLGMFFWAVGAAYLIADIFDNDRMHWPLVTQYLRYPPHSALLGLLNGWLCFPQKSIWWPGMLR
ncbi:MAG TPA: hypothetical protein VIU40_04545 [Geobacteraceae bacterium]